MGISWKLFSRLSIVMAARGFLKIAESAHTASAAAVQSYTHTNMISRAIWAGRAEICLSKMHIDIFRHDTRMLHIIYYYNLCRRGTIIIFVRGSDLFYLRQKYVNRLMRIVWVLSGRESIIIIYINIYRRIIPCIIIIFIKLYSSFHLSVFDVVIYTSSGNRRHWYG